MILDVVVLVALLWVKAQSDMLVIWASIAGMAIIFAGERFFLRSLDDTETRNDSFS